MWEPRKKRVGERERQRKRGRERENPQVGSNEKRGPGAQWVGGRRQRSRCGGRPVADSRGCGSRWNRNCCPGKLAGKGQAEGEKASAKRGGEWREERRKEKGRQGGKRRGRREERKLQEGERREGEGLRREES